MLVLRLGDELEKRVAVWATRQGRKTNALEREALIRYMEDQEDIEMAEAVLKNQSGKPIYSLALPRLVRLLQKVG